MEEEERFKSFPCEKGRGYTEYTVYMDLNGEFNQCDFNVDVCAEEQDLPNKISEEKLTKLIVDKSKKVLDMYVWEDCVPDYEEAGFTFHEGTNPAFKQFDFDKASEVLESGSAEIVEVLEDVE